LTVKQSGARLMIESSDAASAWSKRPWAVIIDEFTSWPDTSNHRRLWTAVVSSLPKRADSRLVVLSSRCDRRGARSGWPASSTAMASLLT
jgi:hypothetical protein